MPPIHILVCVRTVIVFSERFNSAIPATTFVSDVINEYLNGKQNFPPLAAAVDSRVDVESM